MGSRMFFFFLMGKAVTCLCFGVLCSPDGDTDMPEVGSTLGKGEAIESSVQTGDVRGGARTLPLQQQGGRVKRRGSEVVGVAEGASGRSPERFCSFGGRGRGR